MLAVALSQNAVAKSPGAIHCYNDICHRVLTLHETAARIGHVETLMTSFYGGPERDSSNPSTETSSGESFRPDRDDNVASPVFPDGTRLLVWNASTGHAASVRVNNAGPYSAGRKLDASEHLARRLGFRSRGLARLHVVVIGAPSAQETEYLRGRRYAPVQGYLGRFASLDMAMLADTSATTAIMRDTKEVPSVLSGSALSEKNVGHPQPASRVVAMPGAARKAAGVAVAGLRSSSKASPLRPGAVPVKAAARQTAESGQSAQSAPSTANGHCIFHRAPSCD